MIRVLIVDDHPALRAGLHAVLRAEPGIVPVGAAADARELWPQVNRSQPDLVLLDYHLPQSDGLVLCRELKRMPMGPKVLLYSAYADASLAIPALLAGADGLVHKSVPARELAEAIRMVAGGQRTVPPIPRELLTAASERIDPADQPILGMVIGGTSEKDIADTLRIDRDALDERLDAMIRRMRVEVAARMPEAAPAADG